MKKEALPFQKCYAKYLRGCNQKSQEHFISRSILEMIAPFSIQGFPWLDSGETGSASVGSLTAAVLCHHHNSSLSHLDEEAAKLFGHLKLLDSKTTPDELAGVSETFEVDGVKLERWFLKTLCGVMASGNFRINGTHVGKVYPTEYLVNLLFASDAWDVGIGLYVEYSSVPRVNAERGIWYGTVIASAGMQVEIAGIDIRLWGFPFRGLFAKHEGVEVLPNYRPMGLRIVNGAVSREIQFRWPSDSIASPMVVLTRDGTISAG